MKKFMDDDFLLSNVIASTLYHKYAENMPIIDYHCHIDPKDIAEDKNYKTITEIWLGGDHYKWRAMRQAGIPEKYITGDADDYEKFEAFAEVLEAAIGNPLYHWSHLELKQYFGIEKDLCRESAKEIYEECNKILESGKLSAKKIITMSNVSCIGTTDDPVDTLEYHKQISDDDEFKTKVIPTFRPDRALAIDAHDYNQYLIQLEIASGMDIFDYDSYLCALEKRIQFFNEMGCKSSDHSFATVPYKRADKQELNKIFDIARHGGEINELQKEQFITETMLYLATQYAKNKWVMQLHFGVVRNTNKLMFEQIGKDTGFDRILSETSIESLAAFLDNLNSENNLPNTILYSLNPNDNATIMTLCGCFFESGIKSKVQSGAAWWFNDHLDGMQEHLRALSTRGVLGSFVGMLTDSRSLLSYTRHEYFRRILCDYVGNIVWQGMYPWKEETLGRIIENISCNNARDFFNV